MKTIKISFNDDVTQLTVDLIAEYITRICEQCDATAILEVGEEECEDEDA